MRPSSIVFSPIGHWKEGRDLRLSELSFWLFVFLVGCGSSAPRHSPQQASPFWAKAPHSPSPFCGARVKEARCGDELTLTYRDNMGASYHLLYLEYVLDQTAVCRLEEPWVGRGSSDRVVGIFRGRLPPGPHRLEVRLLYRGEGHGVFTYLRDYRFTVSSRLDFESRKGEALVVDAFGTERTDLPLQERPIVRFESHMGGANGACP